MNSLLSSQQMKERLADNGYMVVEDRYGLMLKNTYKKGIGVVHGSSNTGRTIYVEPFEVVDLTNEMKSTQGKLRAEENSILFDMCQAINQYRNEIKEGVMAVAEVDVINAKAKLGVRIGGVVPSVDCDGQINCKNAKHPVLLLRGTEPVGNDIDLSEDATALVISGPNAGGKTVILKTAGLFALMVQHSLPTYPRAAGRVWIYSRLWLILGTCKLLAGILAPLAVI